MGVLFEKTPRAREDHSSPSNSTLNNEKGQVAVLFALVFTFMFVLFAFVVDIGHLINAKMNLQIAADSAAYSGAAWQARTLNRMSQVNYFLRQNVKELAMRVNVTHLRHNRDFPRGGGLIQGGNATPQGVEPFLCQQAHGYRSISGLNYALDTNLCRNADPRVGGLPPIVVPPVIASFDPFAVAIVSQIRRIQQEANRECRAAAQDNQTLVNHMMSVFARRSEAHARQMLALVEFLNTVANEDGNTSDHPLVATARESALRNLSITNREPNAGFDFEILQPSGGRYVEVEQFFINAVMFYFNFSVVGNGCVGLPSIRQFNDMIAGFSKVRNVVTYFAVRLRSRPRLFFMPSAWVQEAFPQLEAIAIAKPFGSRIGPEENIDTRLPVRRGLGFNNPIMNFSVRPNDPVGFRSTKLMAYFDSLHAPNSQGFPDGNRQTGWPEPSLPNGNLALQAIRAPTIFDALFYTIFPFPSGQSAQTDYLEPEFAQRLFPEYLEASGPGPGSGAIQPAPSRTPAYFPGDVTFNSSQPGWISVAANSTGVGGPYAGYLEEGASSHSVVSALGLGLPRVNSSNIRSFGFATPQEIHSSWAPEGEPGRLGYSVKFVGMDFLVNTLMIRQDSGARGNILNPPSGDSNVNEILH